jgi:hypothetical protein
MRFLSSAKYRRKVIIQKPFKGFCKIVQQKRNPETKMQIDFPSENQIGQLKNAVDAAEIKLRGGSIFSDYDTMVKGTKVAAETGLKAWDTGVTIAKSGNAFGEIALGAHALAESIVEWKKGHYICRRCLLMLFCRSDCWSCSGRLHSLARCNSSGWGCKRCDIHMP